MADPVKENQDDLDFTAFFDKAAGAEGGVPPVPDPDPPADEPVVTPPAAAEPPTPEPVDTKKLIDDAVAATAAAFKSTPAPEPDPAAAPPAPDPEAEQKLVKFREDWPEHAEIMDKMLAAQREALMAEFSKLLTPLQGQITPVLEQAELQAQAAHEAAILSVHPDAATIVDAVEAWVKTQPDYLQTAYLKVLEEGTAAQVNSLFTQYKEVTGKSATPAAPAADPAKTRRIAASAPVESTRAATPGVIDPNDFDGAFRAAAAEAQKAA